MQYVLLNMHPETPGQGATVCSFDNGQRAIGTYAEVEERALYLKEKYPDQVYAVALIHYLVAPVENPKRYYLRDASLVGSVA